MKKLLLSAVIALGLIAPSANAFCGFGCPFKKANPCETSKPCSMDKSKPCKMKDMEKSKMKEMKDMKKSKMQKTEMK